MSCRKGGFIHQCHDEMRDTIAQLLNETCNDIVQSWSEIIETNAKNGVVFDATSNEQPI